MVCLKLPDWIIRWAWPNASRDMLLRAALMPDVNEAQGCLHAWLSVHDLDEVTFADHRLLAAIAEKLGPSIKKSPEYPRLKGLQRQLWTQSRLRLNANLPMLRILSDAGIELMLLKGAARIAIDPAAQRQRSQQDVDILVRQEHIQLAARLLSEHGWRTARGDSPLAAISRAATTRAINFQNPPFGDIDLHRVAYHGKHNNTASDNALWANAQGASFFGISVTVPSPAERLTMMLAHGARSPEAHSDWLIDVAELLKSTSIDWQDVGNIIKSRRLEIQTTIGLSYLSHIMGTDFPLAAKSLLCGLKIPIRLGTIGHLFIGREESTTPKYLRPLRAAFKALSRRMIYEERTGDHTPLAVSLAMPLTETLNQDALETRHTLSVADLLTPQSAPQEMTFRAVIHFIHPGFRRRIEIELNSETQNLARFRVLVWKKTGRQCRATLKAKIAITTEQEGVTLETSLGSRLMTDDSDFRSAKYSAVPFKIHAIEF
jgi:hypothetical protein